MLNQPTNQQLEWGIFDDNIYKNPVRFKLRAHINPKQVHAKS